MFLFVGERLSDVRPGAVSFNSRTVLLHVEDELICFSDESAEPVERIVERVAGDVREPVKAVVFDLVGFTDETDWSAGLDFHLFLVFGFVVVR